MAPSSLSLVSCLALVASSQALTYDYVIIGAGTSGLVIANRLSELGNVTVAVIEAGDSVYDIVNVTDVNGYGNAFGTAIDWAYESVNQTYAGGAKQTLRAAKAIGGTSTINGMAHTRAEDVQIDAWEALGNEGWNWESLFPYYLKSEDFQKPTQSQIANGVTYDSTYRGVAGPLKVGYQYDMVNGTIGSTIKETYANLGIQWNHDANGGKMGGLTAHPKTVAVVENVREDATRAYYWPFTSRSNLVMFPNTFANKLVWADQTGSNGTAVASGVQVTSSNGTTYTISARKEVIISTGALRSPLILELSGVGNPAILNPLNISTVVDLPTVGENLQDQLNNGFTFTSSLNLSGTDGFIAYPSVNDLFSNTTSSFSNLILASLSDYATAVANASNNVVSTSDLLAFFTIQHGLIFNSSVPVVEIFNTVTSSIFSLQYWILLPFSRGNIHIASSIPSASALINPNYFHLAFDMDIQLAASKFIRNTLLTTAPWSNVTTSEIAPGFDVLSEGAGDEVWSEYIKGNYRSNFHPVATTAMMSLEKGGVVDSRLKVYGTSNVRVVDAGVLPMQVCGHLVSTLYAVAEKAADLIKEDM